MGIAKTNTFENLMQKLFQSRNAHAQDKKDLDNFKKRNEILGADNIAYQDRLLELKLKVHLFKKQEEEKTKHLKDEITELKKKISELESQKS